MHLIRAMLRVGRFRFASGDVPGAKAMFEELLAFLHRPGLEVLFFLTFFESVYLAIEVADSLWQKENHGSATRPRLDHALSARAKPSVAHAFTPRNVYEGRPTGTRLSAAHCVGQL
jgi:hypothetical protein